MQQHASKSNSDHPLVLANAVRIEKLSDDENAEVDITDDLSDEGDHLQTEIKTEPCSEPCSSERPAETDRHVEDSSQGENAQSWSIQDDTGLAEGDKHEQVQPRHRCPSQANVGEVKEEDGDSITQGPQQGSGAESLKTEQCDTPQSKSCPSGSPTERLGQDESSSDGAGNPYLASYFSF